MPNDCCTLTADNQSRLPGHVGWVQPRPSHASSGASTARLAADSAKVGGALFKGRGNCCVLLGTFLLVQRDRFFLLLRGRDRFPLFRGRDRRFLLFQGRDRFLSLFQRRNRFFWLFRRRDRLERFGGLLLSVLCAAPDQDYRRSLSQLLCDPLLVGNAAYGMMDILLR
jgi:hypothetical protein